MDNMIKVSVIIPIYNVEKYIEECLVSAINQTLREIEIICVNDGTKDHSMEIVKKYAENDSRIVVVNKENGGLSSARNAGIEKAVGEYLYFLDSDDYIRLETLEMLYTEAKKHNLDNIYFDAEAFFEDDEIKKQQENYVSYYKRTREYPQIISGQEMFTAMEENKDFRPSACLQLPRRKMVIENNVRFYNGIIHEDNLFSIQCIILAERVKYQAVPYYFRRVHDDSIMTNIQAFKNSWGYFICLIELFGFMKGKECTAEFYDALVVRLSAIQENVINKIKNVDMEELEEHLKKKPERLQMIYRVMVLKNAKYRQEKELETAGKSAEAELLRKKADILQKRTVELEDEVKAIRNSFSFRIGKILMFIPGKIKRLGKRI